MDSSSSSAHPAPIKHSERHYTSGAYFLPSDEAEADRLQLQHGLLRATFEDRIVLAPLDLSPGAKVLDIGTGTGAWALDFAATYPNADKASVLCIDIGTRLFPQQPPPNVTFQFGDILEQNAQEWENRFAFVHQRLFIGALKYEQWEQVVNKIYTITAPGGWAQLLETNLISHFGDCGPAAARLLGVYQALGKASGMDFLCSLRLEELMKNAGFVDVKVIFRENHLCTSDGDLSIKSVKNALGLFRGIKSPVLRLGGFGLVRDEQEYDDLVAQLESEWKKPGCKAGRYAVVGRKGGLSS